MTRFIFITNLYDQKKINAIIKNEIACLNAANAMFVKNITERKQLKNNFHFTQKISLTKNATFQKIN